MIEKIQIKYLPEKWLIIYEEDEIEKREYFDEKEGAIQFKQLLIKQKEEDSKGRSK
jgi:hypothetical protein